MALLVREQSFTRGAHRYMAYNNWLATLNQKQRITLLLDTASLNISSSTHFMRHCCNPPDNGGMCVSGPVHVAVAECHGYHATPCRYSVTSALPMQRGISYTHAVVAAHTLASRHGKIDDQGDVTQVALPCCQCDRLSLVVTLLASTSSMPAVAPRHLHEVASCLGL